MSEANEQSIQAALGTIPTGLFVLTAAHEDRRAGMLCDWVQRCCGEPPMIVVAVAKGKGIMPLISESRQFALCQIADDDRLLPRKFERDSELGEDPFLGTDLLPGNLPHLPLLRSSLTWIECELACHLDVEGDHDLFVGHVRGGGRRAGNPRIHVVSPDPSAASADPSI
ncbi:MAG: flavin reductase family protein [Planctomycetota bacterium]